MRILITGANGFLASNIIRELNRRNIQVRGIVREHSDLRSLEGAEAELVKGYYGDPVFFEKVLEGCDVVIHAAAFTGPVPTALSYYIGPNVEGTQTVVQACVKAQVKRLIYVSTVNTIEFGSAEAPATEEIPMQNPPFCHAGYAVSKVMAEKLVTDAVNEQLLNAVIVNPAFMIGPNDPKPSSNRIINIYQRGWFQLVPPGGKNFVHVRDVAVAICNAIDRGRSGERYILAHENLTLNQFFDKVDAVTGKKQRRIQVPAWFLRALGAIGGVLSTFGSSYPLTPVTAHILCVRNFYSSEKAISELGLPQTPIEGAINDYLNCRDA
jgi:dihydroflavonol-4-reductase